MEFETLPIEEKKEEENKKLSLMDGKTMSGGSKYKSNFLAKTMGSKSSTVSKADTTKFTQPKGDKLAKCEFYNCIINKPKQTRIIIRNTSGINTNFKIFPDKFLPYLANEDVVSVVSS